MDRCCCSTRMPTRNRHCEFHDLAPPFETGREGGVGKQLKALVGSGNGGRADANPGPLIRGTPMAAPHPAIRGGVHAAATP